MKKGRRVLRTFFFCAAARRQPRQVSQRTQERSQMSEIREFDNLAEIHLSFGTDTWDINFDHWDHFWVARESHWNVEICCCNIPEITKSLEHKCWPMSRKLEKLWILPEGPLRRERWRRVLRTTSLHFLLRCCAPTASTSVPTDAGEKPNVRNSRIWQPCRNSP